MSNSPDPTEEYDGSITVLLLDDRTGREEISCSSFKQAIQIVKDKQDSVTAAKIIDRDDDIVFSSVEMNIEQWETIWKKEKRRLTVDVEEYDCPYNNISCFADDLCVQCKMDKVQDQY